MNVTSKEFQKNIGHYTDIALSGEPVVISRHGRPSVALVSYDYLHQWSFADERWRSVLDRMAKRWPVAKTDYELVTDLLQRWEIEQDAGNSKQIKLNQIYDLLLWIARKLGYKEEK